MQVVGDMDKKEIFSLIINEYKSKFARIEEEFTYLSEDMDTLIESIKVPSKFDKKDKVDGFLEYSLEVEQSLTGYSENLNELNKLQLRYSLLESLLKQESKSAMDSALIKKNQRLALAFKSNIDNIKEFYSNRLDILQKKLTFLKETILNHQAYYEKIFKWIMSAQKYLDQ